MSARLCVQMALQRNSMLRNHISIIFLRPFPHSTFFLPFLGKLLLFFFLI